MLSGCASNPRFGAKPEAKYEPRIWGAWPEAEAKFGANVEVTEKMRASPQWKGDAFENPEGPRKSLNPFRILIPALFGQEERVPREKLPWTRTDPASVLPKGQRARATWLGHSALILEVDGALFLTDPMLSEVASPLDIGPQRFLPPPMPWQELPFVDAVLISHDHYDHLDYETVQHLKGRVALWLVPLGVDAHLRAWGVDPANIRALDWWDEVELAGVRVVCTPARHWSGRGGKTEQTLWSSWSIIGPLHRVFFSGDTGHTTMHKDIGDKLGPFDLTFLEVGAFNPLWSTSHLGPENAVRAHKMLRGKTMVPIHWGTFALGLHSWDEPLKWLLENADVPLAIPVVGESVEGPCESARCVSARWRSR